MRVGEIVGIVVAMLGLHAWNTAANGNIESCPIEKSEYFAPLEVPLAGSALFPSLRIRQGEVVDTNDEAVRTGGTLWPAGQVSREEPHPAEHKHVKLHLILSGVCFA